jgi:PAS domain S-box-containing protein
VTGLIGAVTDITDLKQAQLALRQSEERFRTIFDSVNDLIFVRDVETGALVEVNQRACEMLGYTRDELLKLNLGDLSENKPPYTGQNLLSEMQIARSGTPRTFDWRGKTKDGRLFWAEISMRRATFGGREFVLSADGNSCSRRPAKFRDARRPKVSSKGWRSSTSSPVWPIAASSSPKWAARSSAPVAANIASRFFISIWIILRTSTIRSDTPSATGCFSPLLNGCRRT